MRHWKASKHKWGLENLDTGRLHGMNATGEFVWFGTKKQAVQFRRNVQWPSRIVKIQLQFAEIA